MSFADTLTRALKARLGNLWITTRDQTRVETLVYGTAAQLGYTVKVWRASVGLYDYLMDGKDQDGQAVKVRNVAPEVDRNTVAPVGACQELYGYGNGVSAGKGKGPVLVIFEDLAEYLKTPQVSRWFKDLALKNRSIARDRRVQIVVVDAANPTEDFVGIDLELPTRQEIGAIVVGLAKSSGLQGDLDLDPIIDAVTGLDATQVQRALSQCLVEKSSYDIRTIMRAKKSLIKDASSITWIDPPEGGLKVVGGLGAVKRYLTVAEKMLKASRQNPAIKRPKGFIACGIPGTGKTYLSHCCGAAWGLPVLNFDIGAAMGGIVGQTEQNVDRALEIAKACAPCILCLDELEKGSAGSGGDGRTDGGVMNRVMDKLLKFLNNTKELVYVVVTMNDPLKVGNSNPEFFRRGRFDKVFWVDVPNQADRLEVLQIHARSKGVKDVDLAQIADVTQDYTGAELEAILDEAYWIAMAHNREVTTADCLEAVKGVIPVVTSWGGSGSLQETREWAKRGAIPANDQEQAQTDDGQAKVDLDPAPETDPEPEVLVVVPRVVDPEGFNGDQNLN